MQQTALITGGAVRLGREIALHLAENGWDIALHYHSSRKQAKQTKNDILALKRQCEIFSADFAKVESLTHFFPKVCQIFPRLHLLINSASIYQAASLQETSLAMWERHFSVNLRAPFFLTQAFAKHCKTQSIRAKKKQKNIHHTDQANIINILDNKIAFAQYQYTAYVLSKKALAEFSQLAARELAPNIRVNAIAPGIILPMLSRKADYIKWRMQGVPLQRQGEIKQILMAIDYLLKNEFITGQVLTIDGGETFAFEGRNFASYPKTKI